MVDEITNRKREDSLKKLNKYIRLVAECKKLRCFIFHMNNLCGTLTSI